MAVQLTVGFGRFLWIVVAVAALGFTACKDRKATADGDVEAKKTAVSSDSQPRAVPYRVPELSPDALASGLRSACQRAAKDGTRLLIEFSAPWCGDCRRLAQMKQQPPLRQALAETEHFEVNVGDFDQHEALLKEYRVRAIARWQVVESTHCEEPATKWPKVKARTLEPKSGKKKVDATELAAWLRQVRKPAQGG